MMDINEKILREIQGMKRSLFGDDGTGGIVRCLHEVQQTVCGNPNIPNDNGLVGDVRDIKKATNNLRTDVAVNKSGLKRAWAWLGAISLAIIMAALWVIRAKGLI